MANVLNTLSPMADFLAHGMSNDQVERFCGWLDAGPLVLAIFTPWSIYRSTQKPVCVKKDYDNLLIAKMVRLL